MADSGLSQSITFGTTTLAGSGCIQSASLNRSVNASNYQCNGVMKTALGAKSYVFNMSIALAATDTATVAALQEGDSATTFKWFPGGVTSGNMKVTSTKAWVVAANYSSPVNGVLTADITVNLDNLTDGTSTGG